MVGDSQQGVTKGKSGGLKNLVAFNDGVAALMDEGRTADVICLDLCKAFGTTSLSGRGVDLMDGPLTG